MFDISKRPDVIPRGIRNSIDALLNFLTVSLLESCKRTEVGSGWGPSYQDQAPSHHDKIFPS